MLYGCMAKPCYHCPKNDFAEIMFMNLVNACYLPVQSVLFAHFITSLKIFMILFSKSILHIGVILT